MMRFEIKLSLRFGREESDTPGSETFESQGSLVETYPQPRYVGFEVIE